ncbi:MAG: hypothetical protein M2R45_01165 [Verrucomicrobia subdivision 3 bacterium]|nr:hypothetical protein [Limisphaerales bacterium]MCS1415282.1 hypothetical protein [Limisphaerales bacterium]
MLLAASGLRHGFSKKVIGPLASAKCDISNFTSPFSLETRDPMNTLGCFTTLIRSKPFIFKKRAAFLYCPMRKSSSVQ